MTFDQIEDLLLDDNLEVFINQKGDLAGAKNRDAFEQKLILRTIENVVSVLGETEKATAVRLAEREIERTAQQMDQLENISAYNASFSDDKPDVLAIEVVFNTGEIIEFDTDI